MQKNGKRKYDCLVFDADHTLLDYVADERAAFLALYERIGIPPTEELLALSRRASEDAWTEAGMYDVHDTRVQERYHAVYREHVREIFVRVFEKYPCPDPAVTPRLAGDMFLKNLENAGRAFAGAAETLAALSRKTGGAYRVCIATNGLSAIQRGRLEPLKNYVEKTYISEEVGAIKPLPAFFARICAEQGVEPSRCLMIGDSLSSDVAGALAFGMDCCWYNPEKTANTTPFVPTYEISALGELSEIL
ncbi:MAG: HAD-IA family hydrolase [Clostridia bacterium]|nr:HAD-IA family hydrolase [Clostridia bacterium]